MAAPVIQFKRGAFVNLPGLRAGEPGFTTDEHDLYVGLTSETSTNKFFGSARYWQREISGTQGSGLNLVNGAGNKVVTFTVPENASGIATYKFPTSYTDGNYLRVSSDGSLSWVSVNSDATFTNASLTGITSISGVLNVSANASFTGITTISNVDINDGTIDGVVIGGTTPDEGYFTLVDTDRLISDNSTIGIATATDFYIDSTRVLYDDGSGITLAGIQTIDATTKSTLETILAFDPNNFDTLNVVGIATIGGLLDANGGATIDNVRIGVAGDNEIDTSTGNLTIDSAGGTTTIDDNLSVTGTATVTSTLTANGNVTLGDAAGDTIIVKGTATFEQPIVGTISTATRATTVDITDTDAQSGAIVFGTAGTGATLYNDTDLSYNSNTNVLSVPIASVTTEVRTPAVKAADGTTAITITNATGVVQTNSDLTVGGNLYVNGSTTQINTGSLTVEDRTIELGIVDGAAPSSTTTWDLGVLFNYHDGAAKKSALIWEQGDARFKLGSVVTDGGGTGLTNPQITLTTYAALEIADLWINNTCTGGSTQVIGCIGSELNLQNITVDAGTF